jgi:hypothetical protein
VATLPWVYDPFDTLSQPPLATKRRGNHDTLVALAKPHRMEPLHTAAARTQAHCRVRGSGLCGASQFPRAIGIHDDGVTSSMR